MLPKHVLRIPKPSIPRECIQARDPLSENQPIGVFSGLAGHKPTSHGSSNGLGYVLRYLWLHPIST